MPGYAVGTDDDGNDVITGASALPDEAPFQVGEEIEVGDITDVQQALLPVSKNVHGRIRKAGIAASADKSLKSLKLEIELPDGIMVDNPATGETEAQYVGKVVFPGFMDLCCWASPDRPDAKGWYRSKQHLLGFKELMAALGEDLTKIKINDAFFERITGRDVLLQIKHEADSQKGADGKREKTGTLRERYTGWKKYVGEQE